jgi:hypothetical protein
MFNSSSFYAKSKHAYETLAGNYGMTIRIRMPYCSLTNERSYLNKILKFDNLVETVNSKTSLHDLNNFIQYIIENKVRPNSVGILNFTNKFPLLTTDIIKVIRDYNKIPDNKEYKFVNFTHDLGLKAPRSNCRLSTEKIESLFPNFKLNSELESLEYILNKE